MTIFAETERLILREIVPEDVNGMFELDSDPEVHRYLGNTPVTTIQQSMDSIEFIRKQYTDNGIGRWAVVEKASGAFIGWGGLKLITEPVNNLVNYHDLGYRFIKKYWGLGYATETAIASVNYAFDILKLDELYGIADIENTASNSVLKKAGLSFVEVFEHYDRPHNCFRMTREEWIQKK